MKPKIGGMALTNGIIFRTHKTIVKAKEDEILIDKIPPIFKFLSKIPFLRFFTSFIELLKTPTSKKIKTTSFKEEAIGMIRIVIITAIVLVVLYLMSSLTILLSYKFSEFFTTLILQVIFFIGFYFFLLRGNMGRYHGAEHKIIYSYQNNLPLTLDQVKSNPKENLRCGSSIVAWFIPIILFTNQLSGLWTWGLIAVIYELFNSFSDIRDDSSLAWIKKIFFYPGFLLQQLTTKEPTDDQLKVGLKGFNRLLKEENIVYSISPEALEALGIKVLR